MLPQTSSEIQKNTDRLSTFKGALCSFREETETQNLYIYNINEVIIRTHFLSRCSQRKISSPEHSLKLERWQGPPNVNKVKQYETALSSKVNLFIHS